MIPIKTYYRRRFPKEEMKSRTRLWQTLCSSFFQKYVRQTDTVMDIGAGYCEYINAIHCKKKYAVDINPDTKKFARSDVTVVSVNAMKIPVRYNGKMNVIFMSNFLEHLESKKDVLVLLTRIKSLLAPNGKLIVLQPNIDLVREKYWNFFDHHIIFNTQNIREVFEICGYRLDEYIVRFLPYSTKHTLLPVNPTLIKFYLTLPEFLRPWAGQSLIIASSRSS